MKNTMFSPFSLVRHQKRTLKDTYVIRRWGLVAEGRFVDEYRYLPIAMLVNSMQKGVDIISFPEARFLHGPRQLSLPFHTEILALLKLSTFVDWFHLVKKTGRATIDQLTYSLRRGLQTRSWTKNDSEEIHLLLKQSPTRRGMRFMPYRYSYDALRYSLENMTCDPDLLGYVALFQDRVVGLMAMRVGGDGRVAVIQGIHRKKGMDDLAIGSALVSHTVRELCRREIKFLICGHMGFMQSLDSWKINNGFEPYSDRRFYLPLTHGGEVTIKLGFCKDPWYLVPPQFWKATYPIAKLMGKIVDFNLGSEDRYLWKKAPGDV